jgi:hypothetical protein
MKEVIPGFSTEILDYTQDFLSKKLIGHIR